MFNDDVNNVGAVTYSIIKVADLGSTDFKIVEASQGNDAMPTIKIKKGDTFVVGVLGTGILVLQTNSINVEGTNISGIYKSTSNSGEGGWQRVDYTPSVVAAQTHPIVSQVESSGAAGVSVHLVQVQLDGANRITDIVNPASPTPYATASLESTAGHSTLDLKKPTMITGLQIGTAEFEPMTTTVHYVMCAYVLDGFVSVLKIDHSTLNSDYIYHPERDLSLVQDMSFDARRNREDFNTDPAALDAIAAADEAAAATAASVYLMGSQPPVPRRQQSQPLLWAPAACDSSTYSVRTDPAPPTQGEIVAAEAEVDAKRDTVGTQQAAFETAQSAVDAAKAAALAADQLANTSRQAAEAAEAAVEAHIEEFRPILLSQFSTSANQFGEKDMNVVFCSTNNINDCLVVPSSLRHNLASSASF